MLLWKEKKNLNKTFKQVAKYFRSKRWYENLFNWTYPKLWGSMKAWPRLIGDPRTVERLFSRLPDPEVVDESEDWSSRPKVGLVSLITEILEIC